VMKDNKEPKKKRKEVKKKKYTYIKVQVDRATCTPTASTS